MSDIDTAIPEGFTCGDCAHWKRCKALIYTLEPANTTCDFSPSRFVPTHGSDEGEGGKRPSFLEKYSHEQDAILEAVKPYHDALEKGFAPPPATSEVGTILCDESYSEGPVKRVVAVAGKQ